MEIPRYVAQQGLDVARAPDVRLDSSIGRELQRLGATGEDVTQRWLERATQKSRFDAEQGLIRLSNDLDGQDTADAANMASDGTGWRASRSQAFTTRREAFLNTLPDDLKDEFASRADRLGESYLNRASERELKALGDYSVTGLDTASNNLLQRTAANPASRKQAEETMIALITAAPGLSNAEKEKLLAAVPGRFDEAAALSLVETGDYDGALSVTGSPAGYLETLRARESSGNDTIRAETSSATGRYQFVTKTWNMIAGSAAGRAVGLSPIVDGQEDPRLDATQQEAAVRILTLRNGKALTSAGFQPTERNLYLAHFLGDGGAVKMLNAIMENPDQSAASAFPDAAKANRRLFYDKAGNERTVEDAYRVITKGFAGQALNVADMDLTKAATPDWQRQTQLRRTVLSMIEGRESDRARLAAQKLAASKAARAGELAAISVAINEISNGAGDPSQLAGYERRLYEIGKEIGLENVQTELTGLGDARAKVGATSVEDELAQISLGINDVANGVAGVEALAPLEARLQSLGKTAGAKVVAPQLKALADARAKAAAAVTGDELSQIAVRINDVANGKADPSTLEALETRLTEIAKTSGFKAVETQVKALGDARAKSDTKDLNDALATIAVEINDVANGVKPAETLKPLEADLTKIAQDRGASAVETQLKALADARAKAEKNEAAIADVANRLQSGGLDASNADDRKFFDMLFRRDADKLAKLPAAERNAQIAAISARAGIVPDSVIQNVNGGLMAGSPDRQIEAADLLDRLGATNPALVSQFTKDAVRKAGLINFFRRYGEADPVGRAMEALKVDDVKRDALDKAFAADAQEKGPNVVAAGLEDLAGDSKAGFGVSVEDVPVEMQAEFSRAAQEEYRLHGNLELAVQTAKRQIAAVWGASEFGGDEAVMAYPPEKFFGRPGMSLSDNAAWMREQAERDVAALGPQLGGTDIAGRLTLTRHPYMTGKDGLPVYQLSVVGEDDLIYPVRGADGNVLAWRPDWQTSPEAERRAKDYADRVDVARRRRDGDPGAGRDVNAGKMGGFR